MNQIEQFVELMSKAMPILTQVSEALPALEEFKTWHESEKQRIEAERQAEREHEENFKAWQKRREEEEANQRQHLDRIRPLLK